MKKAIQTFSTIVTVVTFLCIVIAAIFILPKAAGFTPYIVESGSMEPTIHTGAIAFINTKDRDVAAGDVVTYRIGTEEKTNWLRTESFAKTVEFSSQKEMPMMLKI